MGQTSVDALRLTTVCSGQRQKKVPVPCVKVFLKILYENAKKKKTCRKNTNNTYFVQQSFTGLGSLVKLSLYYHSFHVTVCLFGNFGGDFLGSGLVLVYCDMLEG